MPDFEYKSPYRVGVRGDFLMNGVAITFGIRRGGDGYDILHFGEEGATVQRWDHVDAGVNIDEPTFRIQEEFARALYDELAYYFNGQPSIETQRADYLHERGRVDKMIDMLGKVAVDMTA